MVTPVAQREAVADLRDHLEINERRACHVIDADHKSVRYESRRPPETELRARLRDVGNERSRFGYLRLHFLLLREREPSTLNRVNRIDWEESPGVRKGRARRRSAGTRAPIVVEARPSVRWSLDFVRYQFACGRRYRVLNIVNDVTWECLAAIPDTSISERRVAREVPSIIAWRCKPALIVSDDGTEFATNAIMAWRQDHEIK